ncbi:glycosyltransferase family 2 protein [Halomonas sp. BM-2019]|uniref:glycosyltransferase family 2 protein n=1 Tax=Halomonas sp. BM-2019 TaxID=2811227 RepID=UPI001B3C390F|nr:MAG: glycosyltransferase family 2 protein [Halomonas sp. BM-2019]
MDDETALSARRMEVMMTRVIAVVLTYNRRDLLKRCLDAVQKQTRPCDEIFVINNASTDNTVEMLRREEYHGIKVYSLKENLGAAGGFHTGFRMAYDKGADQVWMMDDDVIPEPGALQTLLEADALLEQYNAKRSYLVSTAFTESGEVTNTPMMCEGLNKAGYMGWPKYLHHGVVAVGSGTFVSILVPRQTLETYGLPIAEMFIWGEDAEFTLRITQEDPGYLVGNSKVLHIRHGSSKINIVAENNPVRISYYKNYVRNNVFLARKYKGKVRLCSVVVHNLMLSFRLMIKGEFHKASVVLTGLIQSMRFKPAARSVDGDYDYSCLSLSTCGITNQYYSVTPERLKESQPFDEANCTR